MTVSRAAKGPQRRERRTGNARMNLVNLSFDDTEYKVVLTAANRDGEMALGAWIARQAMAVA